MNIMSLAAEVATARIVDGIADLLSTPDEVVLIVDEVDDEGGELVGKKTKLLFIIILYFFRKCLY